jgi:DNA-directed RNA polymerase subunit RPC12/RpoP
MSDDSSGQTAQALKCSECDAKITEDAIESGGHAVCEYCGALIVLPRSSTTQPTVGEVRRSRVRRAVRRRQPPIYRLVKHLLDKGVLDEKTLRKYTKHYLDKGLPPPKALGRALRRMRDKGKLDEKRVIRAVDELVKEGKLPPRARELIRRFLD